MSTSTTHPRPFGSVRGIFTTRSLVFMGLMAALQIVLSAFTINLSPTFRLFSFNFLPATLVAYLYGPWAAMLFGAAADTIGYLVKPMGPYFPGYALSAVVTNLIYALFFYGKPIRIWRVLAARASITLCVTLGLNLLWNHLQYGVGAGSFFTSVRLMSNLIKLPIYSLFILLTLRIAQRLKSRGVIRI